MVWILAAALVVSVALNVACLRTLITLGKAVKDCTHEFREIDKSAEDLTMAVSDIQEVMGR